MEESIKTVLVVSPHPDDAEIGAGGTIASWVKQGREVSTSSAPMAIKEAQTQI